MRIELVGTIDEHHRLSLLVPEQIRPRTVKVILEIEDEEEDDWAAGVAHIWARDGIDPREDIYTLEDGEPVHGPR